MELTHGSLFSGIGGFDLGFERAGFKSVWQVEIDPYCRAVLAKHFPGAKRHEDVRTVGRANLEPVSVITGGFPCQDISNAGKRAGLAGSRSGLWVEFRRIIDELRPNFVVVENVAALYQRGIDRVLGDLAESGYDAEWDCIPAAAIGAPHLRERIWIVAYPKSQRSKGGRKRLWGICEQTNNIQTSSASCHKVVADTHQKRQQGLPKREEQEYAKSGIGCNAGDSASQGFQNRTDETVQRPKAFQELKRSDWWAVEPNVGRVAHGVSNRVDRLKALGNAIVPQIAEEIAWRIREVIEAAP